MKCLLFIITLTLSFSAFTKEVMQWSVIEWPPIMYLKGEKKGQGTIDWYLDYFQKQLFQYDHKNSEMNFARIYYELERGNLFCHFFSIKTPEREKFLIYSRPYFIAVAPKLFITKESWEMLGKPTKYSIEKLVKDARFKGIVEDDRSFTPKMDSIIETGEMLGNLRRHIVKSENIVKMMNRNRIQYTIEYPLAVDYFGDNNFVEVNIEELPPFSYLHVVCPRNDWGKKKIEEINEVIKKGVREKEFKKRMVSWRTAQARKVVNQNYDKLLRDSQK